MLVAHGLLKCVDYEDNRDCVDPCEDESPVVGQFPIAPGGLVEPVVIGVWKIVGIAVLPVFRHDEGILNYGIKSDTAFILPAGSDKPVGLLWMLLSKTQVGIPRTNQP